MAAEIVDRGDSRAVGTAQEEAPSKTGPRSRMKVPSPSFDFLEDHVVKVDGNHAAFGAGQRLQSLRLFARTVPGLFNNDVESRLNRRLNHRRHMRARRHAEPRDLRTACFHCRRKPLDVDRFTFGWTLPRLFDRNDVFPLTGDDWAHPLGPTPAAEDNVVR